MHTMLDKQGWRAALQRARRSQAWVARQAGVSEGMLCHFATGRQRLPVAVAIRLARILGCTLEEIVVAEEHPVRRFEVSIRKTLDDITSLAGKEPVSDDAVEQATNAYRRYIDAAMTVGVR